MTLKNKIDRFQEIGRNWIRLAAPLGVFIAICAYGIAGEKRTWVSTDGNTIEAEFISATDQEVTIRRSSDLRRFSLPLTRLSEADRTWVKSHVESHVASTPDISDRSWPLSRSKVVKQTEIPKDDNGTIKLPIRFYLITDIEMEQKGVKMSTWVTPDDVEKYILPEINRIWSDAGVEWFIEDIRTQSAAKVSGRDEAIQTILNSTRDAQGKPGPERAHRIKSFCDNDNRHPTIHNLYFFPYLGQTSQGFAALGGNFTVVGVWTDKPSGAIRRPEKFIPVEKEPFKIGSIARTCSHELGHNLGLEHPDPNTQKEFGRLMGGKKHGYAFTSEEIKLARETAIKRAEKIVE